MDIDDTNKDILRLLKDNGRMSFTEIGENLGLSRVAPDVSELKYLARMVSKKFEDKIKTIGCHGVKEIVKDKFGGVEYDRAGRESNKRNE